MPHASRHHDETRRQGLEFKMKLDLSIVLLGVSLVQGSYSYPVDSNPPCPSEGLPSSAPEPAYDTYDAEEMPEGIKCQDDEVYDVGISTYDEEEEDGNDIGMSTDDQDEYDGETDEYDDIEGETEDSSSKNDDYDAETDSESGTSEDYIISSSALRDLNFSKLIAAFIALTLL